MERVYILAAREECEKRGLTWNHASFDDTWPSAETTDPAHAPDGLKPDDLMGGRPSYR